ncbi:MAG: geranylgeranyl reductase family protein [Promethearchaeota archaeon]
MNSQKMSKIQKKSKENLVKSNNNSINVYESATVVIIGGNIAGSYLAYQLASKGIDIIVIEEHSESGKPMQCAGIMSQKLLKLAELDPPLILNRVSIAILESPSGYSIEMRGQEKPVIIDRSGFDFSYYIKAKNKGARFLFNEKFRSYKIIRKKPKNKSFVLVYTNKRKIKAKIIVGCDGPLSKVARINGVKHSIIYGIQIRAKYDFPNNKVKMLFSPKWKELFGWIIPEGNGICRIGLGVYQNPAKKFQEFLNLVGVKNNNIISKQAGLIPYGYVRKIAFERALLLGDSACMVKATTGGGVVMLLNACKIASKAIVESIDKNNFSKNFFRKRYEKPLKQVIGKQLKIHYIIRKILEKFKSEDYDYLFEIYESNKHLKETINIYADMDYPRTLIFRLLFNKEIILFGLKFLFKNPTLMVEIIKTALNIYDTKPIRAKLK